MPVWLEPLAELLRITASELLDAPPTSTHYIHISTVTREAPAAQPGQTFNPQTRIQMQPYLLMRLRHG